MAAAIEFYFDYSSPYGYLAAQRIDEIGAEAGREVAWKPFLLGVVFQITGARPLPEVPLKGDYTRRDFARSARLHDIPFTMPKRFPFMSVAACRATYWAAERDAAAGKAVARALYREAFGKGRDISKPEAVAAVAADLGHDREQVLAALQNPRIKDLLKGEVEAAIKKGVFGSPYIIVDGEPFWGNDRLDDVAVWLETGGW